MSINRTIKRKLMQDQECFNQVKGPQNKKKNNHVIMQSMNAIGPNFLNKFDGSKTLV